jgi:hypothetical protein
MDYSIKELLGYHKRAVYVFLALSAVLFLEGMLFGAVSDLDVCAADRFTIRREQETLWHTHRSLSSFVFTASVWAFLIFLAILVVWGESKTPSAQFYVPQFQWNWNTFFGAAFLLLWYGSSYALLTAMKIILGDTSCGGEKSNSVSGHFSFFFFYGMSLPYLALTLLPYEGGRLAPRAILNPRSAFDFKLTVLSLCYAVFLFGGVITLSQTWSWGYHSLRQIIYGIAFGLGSHLVLRHLFKQASMAMATRTVTIPTRLPATAADVQVLVRDFFPVSYLVIFNAVSVILAVLFSFGFPFNIYEVIGFFVLWPSLIYTFLFLHGHFNSHSASE